MSHVRLPSPPRAYDRVPGQAVLDCVVTCERRGVIDRALISILAVAGEVGPSRRRETGQFRRCSPGARAHGGIDASHEIGNGATNALAALECSEAVVGLSSRLGKPFVLGLGAAPR
jgi:hypothetical protein